MTNIVSICSILLAIYTPLAISEDTSQQTSKEWIFQFDLSKDKNWDEYQVTQDKQSLFGSSNGCTPRIPVIFKKLCVNWNDNDGFALKFKSSNNLNINPNYDDMLWYYGDHNTAKNAEKVAKAKYIDLEEKELTEIAHNNDPSFTLRRRLSRIGTKKCHWYSDAQACAHIDAANENLMTVSVGLRQNNAAHSDYSDYYDDYEDEAYEDYEDSDYGYEDYEYGEDDYGDSEYDYDYEDSDYTEAEINEIYSDYMNAMQEYNQEWATYVQNLNNLYWQNYAQQQQAQMGYYNQYYSGYDSGDDKAAEETEGEGAGEGETQFGISENSIMQKAENEARHAVMQKMEKRMEAKLEKQMMSKMDGGFGEATVHKKHVTNYGGDMDEDHMDQPQSEGMDEVDQDQREPHESLSADGESV